MTIFGRKHHGCDDPWDGAPAHLMEIGAMLAIIMIQNEAILAKVEQRSPKLSPEDQATVNELFDRATADTAKIDAALPKT